MRRRVDVNLDELDQIIDRSTHAPLSQAEGQKLKAALHAMAERLLRKRSTEKTSAVPPPDAAPADKPDSSQSAPAGHGRTGAAAFTGANRVAIARSGACQSAWACSAVNQLPSRTPSFFKPLTRRIPDTKSALSSPQSAASYARRRTAPRRRLIVPGAILDCATPDASGYRTTTVLLNDSRGSEQYHSTNSSIACR
jgi:hypothetical protein